MMKNMFLRGSFQFVSKKWGSETWMVNNSLFCGKQLHILKGKHTSFHYHKLKEEFLYVNSGTASFVYQVPNDNEIYGVILNVGDGFYVKQNTIHQIYAETDLEIIETSTQHFESDSYRLSEEKIQCTKPMFNTKSFEVDNEKSVD